MAQTDVTVPSPWPGCSGRSSGRWGRVDLLVNNAGVFGPVGAVDEIDLPDWQRVVDTNLTGVFLCAHHAVRMMKAQTRAAGGSSTTARSRRTPPAGQRRATPPPSTH